MVFGCCGGWSGDGDWLGYPLNMFYFGGTPYSHIPVAHVWAVLVW